MAKKVKAKRRRRPPSYMMVIRVRVPAHRVKDMQVYNVLGRRPTGKRGPDHFLLYSLEILNAYWDRPGQPGVGLADT